MLTLQKFFEIVIAAGIKNDPRQKSEIDYLLKEEKETYEKLGKRDKEFYDVERLKNPYADTRILVGKSSQAIKKIAAGIDLEAEELLVINELNRQGAKIDLALSHHPEGIALAKLADVMGLQSDMYALHGIPINVMEKIMGKDIEKVMQSVHPINTEKNIDIAKHLGIAYACTHTVADNMVYTFLTKLFDAKKPRTVGDLIDLMLEIPEYRDSAKRGIPPMPFTGSKKSRAGKITVTGFTGGTSGSSEVYESMKHVGIGTEVVMHIKPDSKKEAEKHHINIVCAGHIASDTLGMNLLLDEVEKHSKLEVVGLGGFQRIKRK
ncbi:MAG: NGG1p interacting factor NIF3 [Candidatus Gracilibacteria bacterium]|nr:NGG1p interacting factor NIF3 [Candidatus Gracilibacteria bacterium]MDD5179172.1 NGG1p interacting factor NIF3 [Candidatus Gracilibacteria bacterium]